MGDKVSVLSFVIDDIEPNVIEEFLDRRGIALASFMFYNTPDEADALADGIEKCIRAEG